MAEFQPTAEFANLLTSHQRRLYGYIANFLPQMSDTEEVLQQTNMVLWSKAGDYQPGTSFAAWAMRVAHFEILAFYQRQQRDKKVFSAQLLDIFSAELQESRSDYVAETRDALQLCLQQLNAADRELITRRYTHETPVKELAADLGRPLASVYRSLDRIRLALLQCIQRRATEDGK